MRLLFAVVYVATMRHQPMGRRFVCCVRIWQFDTMETQAILERIFREHVHGVSPVNCCCCCCLNFWTTVSQRQSNRLKRSTELEKMRWTLIQIRKTNNNLWRRNLRHCEVRKKKECWKIFQIGDFRTFYVEQYNGDLI